MKKIFVIFKRADNKVEFATTDKSFAERYCHSNEFYFVETKVLAPIYSEFAV